MSPQEIIEYREALERIFPPNEATERHLDQVERDILGCFATQTPDEADKLRKEGY